MTKATVDAIKVNVLIHLNSFTIFHGKYCNEKILIDHLRADRIGNVNRVTLIIISMFWFFFFYIFFCSLESNVVDAGERVSCANDTNQFPYRLIFQKHTTIRSEWVKKNSRAPYSSICSFVIFTLSLWIHVLLWAQLEQRSQLRALEFHFNCWMFMYLFVCMRAFVATPTTEPNVIRSLTEVCVAQKPEWIDWKRKRRKRAKWREEKTSYISIDCEKI